MEESPRPVECNVWWNEVPPVILGPLPVAPSGLLAKAGVRILSARPRGILSLRRDLDNLEEIFERLLSPAGWRWTTYAAHEEIVGNDAYHGATFIESLDSAIDRLLQARSLSSSAPRGRGHSR